MIRKTQRSGWTAKRIFLALVLLVPLAVYGGGRVLTPAGPVGFAVLGDHADDLRAGLGVEQSAQAAITIVLLNRWDTLPNMPDLDAFCADDCGKGAAGQVSITQMRYRRMRKIVFFHLPDFGGFEAGKDCVIARAAQELQSIRVADPLPCAPDVRRSTAWQLPAGLGRI